MPRLVVGYGRVSTQQQADTGALERQEQALPRATAADEVIVDVGSGATTARAGYRRLLGLIEAGQVERVLVADQDRLNRNLQADLELWALCQEHGTEITDLQGREIEFRSPDGELMSTLVSAMNQHRSRAFGLKTKRGLTEAREAGLPARARIPFGLRKVRSDMGRVVGIELDPRTAPLARQRIEWFLAGNSLTAVCQLVTTHHPQDCRVGLAALRGWLANPMLGGRRCWHRRPGGGFEHVDETPTFPALMTDAEAEAVRVRLAAGKHSSALAGRQQRMLSGIGRCASCGGLLSYKSAAKPVPFLRCSEASCPDLRRAIQVDRVFQVLQYSLALHASALLPLLDRPVVDPPEVTTLQREIEQLRPISGTEGLVKEKEAQIVALRAPTSRLPERALVGGLQLPSLWLQDDTTLNGWLRLCRVEVTVQLAPRAADARVVRISTGAGDAPLPRDQANIVIPGSWDALRLAAQGDEEVGRVLRALLG